MAKLLKLRRGTTSQHSSFTGAEGEVTIDTTKDTAVVHDGSTAAGRPLAREDLNNVSSSTIAGRLSNDSLATSKIAAGALPTDVTVASANIVDASIATGDIANSAINSDKLANNAVTLAKMQNIGSPSFLGRNSSGTGQVQNLSASDVRTMINVENGATADQSASEILTSIKTVDGSGSGLDADLLDSYQASEFVTSAASDTLTGSTYTFSTSTDQKIILQGSSNPYIRFRESSTDKAYIQWDSSGFFQFVNSETGEYLRIGSGGNGLIYVHDGTSSTVWHSGNDGPGSGLNADTCDNLHVNNSESTNTIVARNGSGYVFANYFNASGSFGTSGAGSGMGLFIGTNGSDTYARSYNAAAARSLLNVANGANNITNNNQISNGAGYITSSSLSSYMPKSGGEFTGDLITHNIRPDGNGSRALGTSSYRWSNIYTSDLSLSNEAYGGNDVDGSWGDWTIQEGKSDLFLKNNRSGKTFKFNLTEVS